MAIEIFNELKQGGFLMVPYSLLPYIGIDVLLVLLQIISELNYAVNNELNIYYNFLCCTERMSVYLGMDIKYLNSILGHLQKLKFIMIFNSGIENTIYIRVNTNEIIEYKNQVMENGAFTGWDSGLKLSQNPTNKRNSFCKSTLYIKNFIETHIKNPDTVPVIVYSHLNASVNEYENNKGNLLETITDLDEYLFDMVSKSDFNRYDVMDLVSKICDLSKDKGRET